VIYLDTSALVKLVRREVGSDELAGWIAGHPDTPLLSCALCEVELARALRRSEPELLGNIPAVLGRVAIYQPDDLVLATAAAYPDPALRSLDAIHLATAHAALGDELTAFVSYDSRLTLAARALGLPVASPGVPLPR
jgi:predicted nucleic acid-binding protein